jgi:BCD family chlorophyll transporter-like MFS transporter
MVPGALVTLHHALQLLRPRMGYGSDVGRRRSPWIVGGMAVLGLGGLGAAVATQVMATHLAAGLALAVVAYALIGGGVSAAGTNLLALLAKRVAPSRRAAAATIVWMMMILGLAVTATVVGKILDPFSYGRLVVVAAAVCGTSFLVALAALHGLEGRAGPPEAATDATDKPAFLAALREVWSEPDARRFTVFVFVSMLAYSAQDLILEPFAGAVFGWSPGESTQLSGAHHGGVFLGMVLVAVITSWGKGTPLAALKGWVIGGCLLSGVAMSGLFVAGLRGGSWPLVENVFVLGLGNGVYCIAAIAGMMALAGQGRSKREGTRMGLWGAAQAIALGLGGFLGTVLVDGAAWVAGSGGAAYAFVFGLEALGFFAAQHLAARTAFHPAAELSLGRTAEVELGTLQSSYDAGQA